MVTDGYRFSSFIQLKSFVKQNDPKVKAALGNYGFCIKREMPSEPMIGNDTHLELDQSSLLQTIYNTFWIKIQKPLT